MSDWISIIRIVAMFVTWSTSSNSLKKCNIYPFRLVDFSDLFVTATKPETKDDMRTKAILLF